MNDLITQCESDLSVAVLAIQQPQTTFQLTHFVVGQHDTEPRRWFQCVLELHNRLQLLKRATIERRQALRKIERLRTSTNPDELDQAELMELELSEHALAIVGKTREVQALYAIFESFPRAYTREELDSAEAEYWQKRLTRQAKHSLVATGRIGVGDLDSFEQIGQPVTEEFVKRLGLELCQTSPETISSLPSTDTSQTPAKSP